MKVGQDEDCCKSVNMEFFSFSNGWMSKGKMNVNEMCKQADDENDDDVQTLI